MHRLRHAGAERFGFCLPITEFCRRVRLLPRYYGVIPKGSAFHALLRSYAE